jgi:hypothetical protein
VLLQEEIGVPGEDLQYLKEPFSTRRICSREAKNKSWQYDWSVKKFASKKLDKFTYFFTVCANKFAEWKMDLTL